MGVRQIEETVERLHLVEEEPPKITDEMLAKLSAVLGAPQPAKPPEPRVVVKRVLPDREILGVMAGLGAVLTVRLMLLAAVLGAAFLAWLTLSGTPTGWGFATLLGYTITVIGPLVWLSTQRV